MKNNNLQFCGGFTIEQIPKQITLASKVCTVRLSTWRRALIQNGGIRWASIFLSRKGTL